MRKTLARFYLLVVMCFMGTISTANANLLYHWKFDEDNGNIIKDSVNPGIIGTLCSTKWTEGKQGRALLFDGESSFATAYGINDLGDGFTISLWVNPAASQGGGMPIIINKYMQWCGFKLGMTKTLRPRFYTYSPACEFLAESPKPLNAEAWNNVMIVYARGQMRIFQDGELTVESKGRLKHNEFAPFVIGKGSWFNTGFFKGAIDNVMIFNKPFSKDEAKKFFESGEVLHENSSAVLSLVGENQFAQIFKPLSSSSFMVVAKKGLPGATIVISKNATHLQKMPAKELQDYICRISGAMLPIKYDNDELNGNLILVGASRYTEGATGKDGVKEDSFIIKTTSAGLYLLGNDAMMQDQEKCGTANAVHAFLSDYLNVKWYMPGKLGEVVPEKDTVEIPHIDKNEALYRLYVMSPMFDDAWKMRNFFGQGIFLRHFGGHAWDLLVPPSCFQTNPEWFRVDMEGKRNKDYHSLCVTNRQLWEYALDSLKKFYDEGYEAVEVGQCDGYRRCLCDLCEAQDSYRFGGPSVKDADGKWNKKTYTGGIWMPGVACDRIWMFHDYLAREISKSHPDKKIIMLSYGPTTEPPQRIASLPDNVVVELCNYNSSIVGKWVEYCKPAKPSFCTYTYWFGYENEMLTVFPLSYYYVASDFKRLVNAGVVGFYLYGGGSCWGISAPTYYLIGRLLRNPDQDPALILKDFCDGLFGKASPRMHEYFNALFKVLSNSGPIDPSIFASEAEYKPKSIREKYSAFNAAMIKSCDRLLEQAYSETDDKKEKERILYFTEGFKYMKCNAEAFLALNAYENDKSQENLNKLQNTIKLRNGIVRKIYDECVIGKIGQEDLPPIFCASHDRLLDGGNQKSDMLFKTYFLKYDKSRQKAATTQ